MKLFLPLIISAVLLGLGGTQNLCYADTSNDSASQLLPASPLYMFKTMYECVRIFFTFDPLGKAELLVSQAETRLEEAKNTIEQGNAQTAIKLLLTNTNYLTKAQNYLEKATKTPRTKELVNKLKQSIKTYKQKLGDLKNVQDYDFTQAVQSVDSKNKQTLEQIADKIDSFELEQASQPVQTTTNGIGIMRKIKYLFKWEFVSPIIE